MRRAGWEETGTTTSAFDGAPGTTSMQPGRRRQHQGLQGSQNHVVCVCVFFFLKTKASTDRYSI